MLDSMFLSTCFLTISPGLANLFWNWLVIGLIDLNLCTLDLYEKKLLSTRPMTNQFQKEKYKTCANL